MGQIGTRKRPAPGASPLTQRQQNAKDGRTASPEILQNGTAGWSGPTYTDPTDHSSYDGLPVTQQNPMQYQSSNSQVARRATNQNLIQTPTYGSVGSNTWVPDGSGQTGVGDSWSAPYDELEQRAETVKRDAQAKRRILPPFIQKLSSFLDESRNTDLICWSESGDSFIVLDEDEFAKTLIPELFKTNRYASFVRQLNSYGFHKKVGLSDNSMRASENKNKNPSEYSNPYFKRGRPNLLWLIHKPKNAPTKVTGKGRNKQDEYDEDVDETFGRDNSPMPMTRDQLDSGVGYGRDQPLLTMGNMVNRLPQDEMSSLRQELSDVQRNQRMIRDMLQKTRQEHQALYGQAKMFHELHEKHDNSINAILTFLATVYNKNLASGQNGSGDMFPGAIPAKEQPRGNVVDIGDDKEQTTQPPFRRPQLLLEGTASSPGGRKANPTGRHKSSDLNYHHSYPQSPAIQELSDHTPSNRSSQSPQVVPDTTSAESKRPIPEADILSMVKNHNAQSTNMLAGGSSKSPMNFDFDGALSHIQNADGQAPLTPNQRQNMLQLMANEHSAASPNTALTYPNTPSANSLSNFDLSADQLTELQRSFNAQEERLANLQNTIAPLSPSGSIPGVTDGSYHPPQDLSELDQFFNSGDYFNDGTTHVNDFDFDNAQLSDVNFDFETGDDQNGAAAGAAKDMKDDGGTGVTGREDVEGSGSNGRPSPADAITTETSNVPPDTADRLGGSPGKRQRQR